MRVLFVYPNLYTQMGFNHGLASLSAVLKQQGHQTRLVNLNENLPPVPTPDELWSLVRGWQPGLIGFSCLTQQYRAALEIAEDLRARAASQGVRLPPLVVGGIHPTMVPAEVMADGAWDHVGVGECEDALAELVRRVEAGERPDDVRNFVSWKGGLRPTDAGRGSHGAAAFAVNPVGEFPDFARLPLPDYELFDVQRITDQKHGWFGLISSRGCPYRCTYCLNHKIVDRYKAELGRSVKDLGFFRFRPAAALLDEIRHVLARYRGIGTFILDDDLFTQNVPHALEFCAAYAASGIGVPFVANAHVKQLDERVAQALAQAGCRILKLGIESGSARVRKEVLKRHMTHKDILETVAAAERHGLHTSGFVMVGLPGETRAERWETVDLLAEARIGRYRTSFFYPFPGTDSYRLAVEGGWFDPVGSAHLTDFTEGSILDFGPEENLFVDQLGTVMPWFVNARLERFREAPASARWRPLVERVLAMDAAEWAEFKPRVRAIDAELAAAAAAAGEEHYAIRYNAFMGVRSDFYLAEERGLEWATAAARPAAELREAALAAAAAEVC
ncbi:MAG: B12-binding domain-containing radical SAM protein [Planctomycetes bacterium]|nr:B12-binding domain-containing radical SAM protein [Planctomycetota bacterium]